MIGEKRQEIGDPCTEGWLSGICSMPDEVRVTVSGVRKLPGRPAEYCDGAGTYHSRAGYENFTEALIGYRLDPCTMWAEMGHDINCDE